MANDPIWQAQIASKSINDDGEIVVVVDYTRGNESDTREYKTRQDLGDTWPEDQIQYELKCRNAPPEIIKRIEVGTVYQTNAPTPDVDAAAAAYQADIYRYLQYQTAVKLGVDISRDTAYPQLQARLKANFKTEYLEMMPWQMGI